MQNQMTTMQKQMAMVLEMIKKDDRPIQLEKEVEIKVGEMLEEQREKDEKRNNIIIFNIEEAQDSAEEGKEMKEDIKKVREVLSELHPDPSKIDLTDITLKRFGIKKQDKMRPIRVKLMDNSSKGIIFKNSWKLKQIPKFKKIGIANDKTTREQIKDRELRTRLQDKKNETGEDDWIIHKNEIIKRSDKPPRSQNQGASGGR